MTDENVQKEVVEIKKDNKQNWAIMLIIMVLVSALFIFFFKAQVNDATLACSPTTCDLNKVYDNQAVIFSGIGYNIQQDANIMNAIKSEAYAEAFLKQCKLLSQDFNVGTQTIICPTQGGG